METIFKLRPHHGLCIGFFHGNGYSEAFTQNMTEVIACLHRNPDITLTCSGDILCGCCPHDRDGICETAEKVHCYDMAVLSLCDLYEGQTLHWKDFRTLVEQYILRPEIRETICSDCAWNALCK